MWMIVLNVITVDICIFIHVDDYIKSYMGGFNTSTVDDCIVSFEYDCIAIYVDDSCYLCG